MFGLIGDIDAFMSLWDRLNKWRRGETPRSMVEQRFVRLFTEHGVARSQIPKPFGEIRP